MFIVLTFSNVLCILLGLGHQGTKFLPVFCCIGERDPFLSWHILMSSRCSRDGLTLSHGIFLALLNVVGILIEFWQAAQHNRRQTDRRAPVVAIVDHQFPGCFDASDSPPSTFCLILFLDFATSHANIISFLYLNIHILSPG